MKLLVDTHTFLWLMESPEKLSDRASDACSDPTNSLHLSAATLWEIQIKSQLGRLDLDVLLKDMDFVSVDGIIQQYASLVRTLW